MVVNALTSFLSLQNMTLSSNDQKKKLILVIGATGAQGLAVIDALLSPSTDGNLSPYAVRALTRDVNGKRAQELTAKGVECVEGEPHLRTNVKVTSA